MFEGEGSICGTKTSYGLRLRLDLSQKENRAVVERFLATVGKGKIYNKKHREGRIDNYSSWGKDAHEVIEKLIPFFTKNSLKEKKYRELQKKGVQVEKHNKWHSGCCN